ncbi:hypothetical protein [Salibacterium halotolerans]|uniref:Uncharacterized protein n=1 Tax=Salibacterium halotolerans TaxID=1884432 RepID=A0A1I5NKJ2_9BACI|nr:hypothetical protein [Salibacterium halotolerans]SFP22242.1 hypothetical protein SAMN05518683_103186 [Salibacterium halotolerans]
MFKGNKLIVLLPLTLMIFLFIGGGFYINQAEEVTNENLSEEVQWDSTLEPTENGARLTASWEWGHMPSDGLHGTDYIGITFLDENGEPMTGDQVERAELLLDLNNEEERSIEPETTSDGVLFAVPNEMEDNQAIGSSGTIDVRMSSNPENKRVVMSYLHTWEEHGGLETSNTRFFDPSFHDKNGSSFYWVIEHFVERGPNTAEEESA